jgi:hypothetical protein
LSEPVQRFVFEGKAKVGEIMGNITAFQLKPEDLTSPLSLQMAITRFYNELMKMLENPKKKFVAEVKFSDSLGNSVSVGIDLGDSLPPLPKKELKAKVIIELYEEEED